MFPPSIRTLVRPHGTSPDFTAAETAAHAEVPDADVAPTPRSQIRIAILPPGANSANWTLVPRGNAGCAAISGP